VWVETAVGAHAASEVDGKRLNFVDGFADITRVQSTGKEDGHWRLFYDE
jgi:hypothetical protein